MLPDKTKLKNPELNVKVPYQKLNLNLIHKKITAFIVAEDFH